jgi:hypothetical protein
MNIVFKTASRRYLSLSKRDYYGLNALDRLHLKEYKSEISLIGTAIRILKTKKDPKSTKRLKKLKVLLVSKFFDVLKVLISEAPERTIRANGELSFESYFQALRLLDITPSESFRFQNVEQLGRMMRGFQIPDDIRVHGYKFSGEEIIIISLIRLSFPSRWNDIVEKLRIKKRWALGRAFYWFLEEDD